MEEFALEHEPFGAGAREYMGASVDDSDSDYDVYLFWHATPHLLVPSAPSASSSVASSIFDGSWSDGSSSTESLESWEELGEVQVLPATPPILIPSEFRFPHYERQAGVGRPAATLPATTSVPRYSPLVELGLFFSTNFSGPSRFPSLSLAGFKHIIHRLAHFLHVPC